MSNIKQKSRGNHFDTWHLGSRRSVYCGIVKRVSVLNQAGKIITTVVTSRQFEASAFQTKKCDFPVTYLEKTVCFCNFFFVNASFDIASPLRWVYIRSYTKERITEIWRDNKLIVGSTEKSVTIDKTVSLFFFFRIFFCVTVPLHRFIKISIYCRMFIRYPTQIDRFLSFTRRNKHERSCE